MPQKALRPSIDRNAFLAPFVAAGCLPVEPAILQPADLFLDLSGEELGKRLYLTSDAMGRELCLRPDFTPPICAAHIAGGDPTRPARYCYFGKLFRYNDEEPDEFLQAGVESFGHGDVPAADAEVFALALDCLHRHGLAAPRLRIGDTGLFDALLTALDLPEAWRRRLARDFGRSEEVAADLASLDRAGVPDNGTSAGTLATLASADRAAARAFVEDRIAAAAAGGAVVGRSVAEIVDRVLEQAELARTARLAPDRAKALADYLALRTSAAAAPEALVRLLGPLGPGVTPALDRFVARNAKLAARGIDLAAVRFDAAFGRRLDYYSGFVFDMRDPARPDRPPVVGGGRYDGMFAALGAPVPVPAVGFSVWVERLPGGSA